MFLQMSVCPRGGAVMSLPVWRQGEVYSEGGYVVKGVHHHTPSPELEAAAEAGGTHPTGMHSCLLWLATVFTIVITV